MSDASGEARRLGARLRQLREEYGQSRRLTQPKIAELMGVGGTTISSYEHGTVLVPRDRLFSYATFFTAGDPDSANPRLPDEEDLSNAQRVARDALYAELLALREPSTAAGPAEPAAPAGRRRTWRFEDGAPVRLVCGQVPQDARSSLATSTHPNYTELLSFADLDAMVELFGHLRAENPGTDVRFLRSEDLVADDLSGHVILLGGLAWNQATQWFTLRSDLPAVQVVDPTVQDGDIFEILQDGKPRRFYPTLSEDRAFGLIEDVGLFARLPNPYNQARTLTVCNGVFSRGVLGAVRCLTDAKLRTRNENYLDEYLGGDEFGLLMRVPVIKGAAVTPDLHNPYIRLFTWS